MEGGDSGFAEIIRTVQPGVGTKRRPQTQDPKTKTPSKSFWNHLKRLEHNSRPKQKQGATRFVVIDEFDQGLRFVHNPAKSTKRRPLQNPYPYVTRMYPYVTRMYPYVTRMYPYVTRMYPYVPVCSVCYDIFYTNNPAKPTNYLKEMPRLILQESSFQFIGKDYL